MATTEEFDDDEAPTLPGFTHQVRSARVLLAEDDDEMRALVTEVLTADGREVVAVGDGEQLLDALTEAPYDVIVTDHRMPHGDGIDVIAALRAAGAETPVLLITGHADEELRARADDLETMVMHKPFPLPAFRAAVDVLISLRPR
jgi:CheY-like chemotaxis protein